MKIGAMIFGALAVAFGSYLLLGLALSGRWEAQVEELLPGPPSVVFPHFNRMALWPQWSPMPASGIELFGPPEGTGAGLRWDDPQYGRGEVRILDAEKDRSVEYEVSIEGGRMSVRGSLMLEPAPGGTKVVWREEGDFGRNPLLGFAARRMPATQADAMRAGLLKLRERF